MQVNRAILNTLLYGDLFNFPLKKEEIWFYLISNEKISYKDFLEELKKGKNFSQKGEYFFLPTREKIVSDRIKREKHSQKLIKEARRLLGPLFSLPTVKLIGISGSLALHGASSNDDIDVFIVSEKNLVWTTRFFSALYLVLNGKYRWKNDKNPSGKFCLNMIIGEDFIFSQEKKDLYTAHEISQMLPLFYKNDAYLKFMLNNKWILKFLPNVFIRDEDAGRKDSSFGGVIVLALRFLMFEHLLKFFQKLYMKQITTEVVGPSILAFHPKDYRKEILKSYRKVQK